MEQLKDYEDYKKLQQNINKLKSQ